MLKKVALLAALNISFLIANDTSKENIVWRNDVGRLEDTNSIYYVIKNDEHWTTQYGQDMKEKTFFARSVSKSGMQLGVRMDPKIVQGYFEKYEKQFNQHN